MKIERYEAYKNSEIEWLEKIPEHWLSVRIKDVIKHIDQGWSPNAENRTVEEGEWGVLKLSAISNGKYYEINHKALPNTTDLKLQYVVKKDDLLITRSNTPELVGDCCLVLVEPTLKLMYSDLIYCLRINPRKILDRYLNYFLCSVSFRWLKTVSARGLNTSMVKISQGIICRWNIFSPHPSEQKMIAHYLDTKTAQIDRKIDLLTQKATLYGNLKQSLINETVTRGLDKSVPVKDSGIEWLGKVPEHWKIKRLKDISPKITTGGTPTEELFVELGFKWYTPGDFSGCLFLAKSRKEVIGKPSVKIYPKNSILIVSIGATLGKVGIARDNFSTNQQINIIYPSRFYSPLYMAHFLSASIDAIKASANASTIGIMNQSKTGQILVILPPLPEQKAIADYLDTKTAQIDQIIQTINTQIEKLRELRKTLINDVVTGKIRVIDNE